MGESIAANIDREIVNDVLTQNVIVEKNQKFYSYLKCDDTYNKDLILMIHKDQNYNA